MAFCPVCKTEWEDGVTECPVCSRELGKADAEKSESTWVLLGFISDPISADYAREVLKSYDIPAVVISKSGFFGQAGLTLPGFYSAGSQLFEVSTPEECVEEALGVLDMVLGDKWQHNEKES